MTEPTPEPQRLTKEQILEGLWNSIIPALLTKFVAEEQAEPKSIVVKRAFWDFLQNRAPDENVTYFRPIITFLGKGIPVLFDETIPFGELRISGEPLDEDEELVEAEPPPALHLV